MRTAKLKRDTKETSIKLELDLDGSGDYEVETGVSFFNHMLQSFAKHGLFDLRLDASGDVEVSDHHVVEDVGIVLGEAIKEALGDKKGIRRFAHAIVPMDDSLATCAIDLGGRSCVVFDASFGTERVGDMSTENVKHFLESLAGNADININIRIEGDNDHHQIEAMFKALAISLDDATRIDERKKGVPSTKGSLD